MSKGCLVTMALCLATAAHAQEPSSPVAPVDAPLLLADAGEAELRFGQVTASGRGCPAGQYEVVFQRAEDGTVDERIFTIYYYAYRAEITRADDYADSSCTVIVPVKITPGWQYAVTGFVYHGTASLAQGMTADIEVSYNYMGDSALELARKSSLSGPLSAERFEIIDVIPMSKLANDRWSTCGGERTFVVTTSMTIANGATRGVGYVRMTDITASPPAERALGTRTRVAAGDFVPGKLSEKTAPGASFRLGLRRCP